MKNLLDNDTAGCLSNTENTDEQNPDFQDLDLYDAKTWTQKCFLNNNSSCSNKWLGDFSKKTNNEDLFSIMGESGVKNVFASSIDVSGLSKNQKVISSKLMSLISIEQFDEPEIMPSSKEVPLARPTIHVEGLEKDSQNIISTPGFIHCKGSDNLGRRGKLSSLPLQDVKRISLDSKIPNIVNMEASPKLSQVSDMEDAERSPDRCPSIAKITKIKKKFNTDALA